MSGRLYCSARATFISVTLCLLSALLPVIEARTCNHVHPTPDEVVTGVHLPDVRHITRRSVIDDGAAASDVISTTNLRIKLSYDDSVYRLPNEKYNLIHDVVLPSAVQYWERALSVTNTAPVIRLNRKCADSQVFLVRGDPHVYCNTACEPLTMCGEVPVPAHHLNRCRVCDQFGKNCRSEGPEEDGPGIPGADFVFYISAVETQRCKKGFTVAYAAHCQQEQMLDRPIAGHVNLCPASINTARQEADTLLSTVKHEILHALGFSVSLYAFYRDSDGRPLTNRTANGKPVLNEQLQARQWSDRVIKSVTRPDWRVRPGIVSKTVNMVVTPRVVAEVRRHFNCSTLEGAELEDQGREGTALTHWEKRLFENEAMTGTHTQNPVYSRLTLALLEDTGWYRANYDMAQPLAWGKGLGCAFATESCLDWMTKRQAKGESLHPYCNKVKRDPLQTECTDDRSSVALCNLVEYPTPLPARYQNFQAIPHISDGELGLFGGSVSLADYCPYIQEFTWKSQNVVVRGSHCNFPENNPEAERNFALEKYSDSSVCVYHDQEWTERTCSQMRTWQHWGSGCYEYTCRDNRLHLLVANHTYTCYHAQQVISIKIYEQGWLHMGGVVCPPCQDICEGGDKYCRSDKSPPPLTAYYRDQLVCAGVTSGPNTALLLLSTILVMMLIKRHQSDLLNCCDYSKVPDAKLTSTGKSLSNTSCKDDRRDTICDRNFFTLFASDGRRKMLHHEENAGNNGGNLSNLLYSDSDQVRESCRLEGKDSNPVVFDRNDNDNQNFINATNSMVLSAIISNGGEFLTHFIGYFNKYMGMKKSIDFTLMSDNSHFNKIFFKLTSACELTETKCINSTHPKMLSLDKHNRLILTDKRSILKHAR